MKPHDMFSTEILAAKKNAAVRMVGTGVLKQLGLASAHQINKAKDLVNSANDTKHPVHNHILHGKNHHLHGKISHRHTPSNNLTNRLETRKTIKISNLSGALMETGDDTEKRTFRKSVYIMNGLAQTDEKNLSNHLRGATTDCDSKYEKLNSIDVNIESVMC